MKKIIILSLIALLSFSTLSIKSAIADNLTTGLSQEKFDLYVYLKSSLLQYACVIDDVPCRYNEAVVPGKKPNKKNAQYIGTGHIHYKKIALDENELFQARMAIFKVIDVELSRNLSRGIMTIKNLLDSQEDVCDGNSHFEDMIKKLTKKIEEEERNNGKTELFKDGQALLRKLKCQ